MQMCDALSRNELKEFHTLLCHCLLHKRRQFVDVVENFPEECRKVIESLREVYRFDALTQEQKLSDQDRLAFHQAHSQPVMDDLQKWMQEQIEQKKVEPNSGLGEAIQYMLKRWQTLTRFLSVPGKADRVSVFRASAIFAKPPADGVPLQYPTRMTGSISWLSPLRFVVAEPSRRATNPSHNLTGATQTIPHNAQHNRGHVEVCQSPRDSLRLNCFIFLSWSASMPPLLKYRRLRTRSENQNGTSCRSRSNQELQIRFRWQISTKRLGQSSNAQAANAISR
jgi:Transposase IS66 family